MRPSVSGLGAITVVISLLITLLLLVFYLRASVSGGPKGSPPATALEAAKRQAQVFEEQQRKRLEQMKEASQ